MPTKTVFATVGTTSFDELIQELLSQECLQILSAHGYSRLTVQYGRGRFEPTEGNQYGMDVRAYRYKDSIQGDLSAADLVISHAGAGSVLETLGLNKRLLVVVNDTLMDNHQTELAEEFAHERFLHWTTVKNLRNVLSALDWSTIRRYESGRPEKFAHYLDEFLGL